MIQFPDKDRATLREIAVFNTDDETHRKAIMSALFRAFWQIEDGKVEWWQVQSEGTELNMDRQVMAAVASAGCLRVPVDLPDDEDEAFGYLASLDYADYTESFCSAYIDRLMIFRRDFETVRKVASSELHAVEAAHKSNRGRQVVDERHASARTMLEQAVNKGKEMYRNGDERDHVQMTNDLIGKTEPGGAQPFKDVTVNTLRKRLSKFLQEEGKNNLVVGLPEYYASRR